MTAKAEPLLGTAREWAIDFAVAATVGLFVGVIGPYGSYLNGAPGLRVFHFVVCFLVGTLIFGVLQRLAVAGAERLKISAWLAIGAALLVGCAFLSVFISWLGTTLWPFLRGKISPLEWYAQCVFLSGPVLSFVVVRRIMMARDRTRDISPRNSTSPFPSPAAPTPGEVVCLRMEDHYVRVHTAGGSRLIAGPLERVVAGLGEREGMRVHRSWWVARDAVVGVEVDGRNLKLKLSNGVRAPVSRASVAKLRQVGWLPSDS